MIQQDCDIYKTIKETFPREDILFRGVSREDYEEIKENGFILKPSIDMIPFDCDVLSKSLNGYQDMSQKEINEHIKRICSWFDGSFLSICGGVNVTTRVDIASSFASSDGVIFILKIINEENASMFNSDYIFCKDVHSIHILGHYDLKSKEIHKNIISHTYNLEEGDIGLCYRTY